MLGIILGRDDDSKKILARFRPWLEAALAEREWTRKRNGSPADEARWYEALALYDWLIDGIQNELALDRAWQHWRAWYAAGAGKSFKGEIGSLFALAIDAGRQLEIIDLYARPLTRSTRLSTATSEAGFGNHLAHQLLEQRAFESVTEGAFDRFLSANMHENWLSRGHYKTAAHWLKLRFWNFADPKPEPFAVVRRALDYIPEEARQ